MEMIGYCDLNDIDGELHLFIKMSLFK